MDTINTMDTMDTMDSDAAYAFRIQLEQIREAFSRVVAFRGASFRDVVKRYECKAQQQRDKKNSQVAACLAVCLAERLTQQRQSIQPSQDGQSAQDSYQKTPV